MKLKSNQMIIIAAVVVLLSVAWVYITRGGKAGSGKTIITDMPQAGYSIDNDGFDSRGIPESLPDTLPPPPEVDVPEPEMMGMMEPTTMPSRSESEEFTQYAPRRFKGDIL